MEYIYNYRQLYHVQVTAQLEVKDLLCGAENVFSLSSVGLGIDSQYFFGTD